MDAGEKNLPVKLDVDDPSVLSAMKDLEAKDSISHRTTFSLSAESTEILKNLSERLGLTQKDIFTEALKIARKTDSFWNDILTSEKFSPRDNTKRVRKTYVIGKNLNRELKKICTKHKISRDRLLDRIVIFYDLLLNALVEMQKKSYEKSLELIAGLVAKAEEIEYELRNMPLYKDDVLIDRYSIIVTQLINLDADIKAYLEEGIEIEPW